MSEKKEANNNTMIDLLNNMFSNEKYEDLKRCKNQYNNLYDVSVKLLAQCSNDADSLRLKNKQLEKELIAEKNKPLLLILKDRITSFFGL